MRLNRIENTKRNIKYGILNKLVRSLLPFLLRTILIRKLGIEYAGIDSLLISILQVLNLAELGFSNAIVYSMYKPIAENNEQEICSLLLLYKKVYFRIGIFIFVLGLCGTPLLFYFSDIDLPDGFNIYIAFLMYLVDTTISYLMYGYKNAVLVAYQRDDIIYKISSVTKGILYLFQIFIIWFIPNYYIYTAIMIIFTIVNNLMVNTEVNKLFPGIKCKGNVDKSKKNDIKEKVSGVLVTKVCQVSRNTFDSLFISLYLGVTLSGIYGNYYYISSTISGFLSIMATSMLAGIGNSIQLDTIEKNYQDLFQFDYMYMWISGFCGVCLLCLYQPFMNIWIGEKYVLPMITTFWLCIYFYVIKMGDIRGIYMQAIGLWWENRIYAILEAVGNLFLNWIFVQVWGLNGIITATLISLFVFNFLGAGTLIFKYYFKKNCRDYFMYHFKYIMIWIIIGGLTYQICQICSQIVQGADIIIRGIICVIVPNTIWVLFNIKNKRLKTTFQFMKNII